MPDFENEGSIAAVKPKKNTPMRRGPGGPGGGPPGGGPMGFMRGNEKPTDLKGSLKKLMAIMKPFWWRILAVIAFALIATFIGQYMPQVMARLTNILASTVQQRTSGMTDAVFDYAALNSTLLTMFGFYAAQLVLAFLQGYTSTFVTTTIAYNMRNQIIRKINTLPVGFIQSQEKGDIMSRITNDVQTLSQTLTQTFTQIITTLVTLGLVLYFMLTMSWKLTLVALLMIPGSALVTLFMVKVSQKYFRKQQSLLGTVNGVVEEILSGHTVVKAFNGEGRVLREFNEQNEDLYNTAWKAQFLTGFMMPLMNFIGNIGYVAICMLGAYFVTNNIDGMDVGKIQAFITYIRNFTQPITQLANMSSQLQSTAAAAERVFKFLDEPDEVDIDTRYSIDNDPIIGNVVFEHVKFAYDFVEKDDDEDDRDEMFEKMRAQMEERMKGKKKKGGKGGFPGMPGGDSDGNDDDEGGFPFGKKKLEKLPGAELDEEPKVRKKKSGELVIKDFSATVKAGQKVAIVGKTGAGKTTMVKLLMRFHNIAEGAIYVDGRDIARYARSDLRREFGMVLQDTWLFNGTIMENIRYGRPDATDEEVYTAARAAQVDHFVRTLPESYDMILNEESTNISQGQKQLLTIARAILADAKILILDEATSSVDTRTEILIQRAMDNLLKGRTSFIIAHRLSTIRNADLILFMKDGDIAEQGTHEELLAAGGEYASLYNSQFENAS